VGAIDVGGLLREMGDLLARSIAKSAAIRHEYAPGLPPVLADATQLRQVALNLIVNASDALGDRPGTITLRTALVTLDGDDPDIVPGTPAAPGEYVLLEVVDTGRGMDAATRARIFDPFFTTKTTGRGLGLAATLGIVKGHGGAIRVRSQAGSGTTIGVLLRPAAVPASGPDRRAPAPWTGASPVPLPAADGTTATATPTAAEGLARDADTPSLGRILIVDDEPTVRTLGRRVLERAGYTVTEAGDGPEGIEAFADDPASWAGVLLDLTLPTLDGMVVLAEVRRLRPGIPAVICSGWAAEEVTERLAEMPGTLVLEKPYAASALVEAFRVSIAAGGHG
jgi:CheY-like chemotaxis protein